MSQLVIPATVNVVCLLTVKMVVGFLGHLINGTQAEYVHIPRDGSHAPETVVERSLGHAFSNILPASYGVGSSSQKPRH